MGGSGGGGSPTYVQPSDPYGDALKRYQLEQLQKADAAVAEEKKIKAEQEAAKKQAATLGFDPFKETLKKQLSSGLLSYQEAQAELQDYSSKYDIGPQPQALQGLTDYYLTEIQPGQQKSQIETAYEELLGKGPSAEQLTKAQKGFQSGYYKSVGDLKETLKLSDEYQEKFNKSYLDNYYETMFGKAKKNEAGQKTYNFKLQETFLPKYVGDLAAQTGVEIPKFQTEFTGTAGEIEANLDAIKETKKFVYSAGLTNLQGEIDKETQKLKNEGGKEIAKIQQEGGLYTALVGAFNFS
jgi:hypothetical protein